MNPLKNIKSLNTKPIIPISERFDNKTISTPIYEISKRYEYEPIRVKFDAISNKYYKIKICIYSYIFGDCKFRYTDNIMYIFNIRHNKKIKPISRLATKYKYIGLRRYRI